MKDIAEKVGVDRSTVSLALKNDPRISEKTRERIHEAAKELGYRPDPAFKILGAQRWKSRETTTGFVIAFITHPESRNDPATQLYRQGARQRAEELGFSFSDFHVGEYPSTTRANQVLVNRGVSGLLFARPTKEEELEGYDWNQFSSITLGVDYFQPKNHAVQHNQSQNLHMLWAEAARRGAKRIGMILRQDQESFDYVNTISSLLYEQQQGSQDGMATIPTLKLFSNQDYTTQVSEVGKWTKLHDPQVIIGYSDAVYDLLAEAEIKSPKDVSFLSLKKGYQKADKIAEGKEISGIDLNLEKAGEIATSMLSSQILQNERDLPKTRLTHLVETSFVEGDTFRKKFR